MKVLIEIDEKTFKDFHEFVVINIGRSSGKTIIEKCLKAISKGTPIPNNATNGDVIKAMFPNYKFKDSCGWVNIYIGGEYGESYSFCPDKFWDAPYKGETHENKFPEGTRMGAGLRDSKAEKGDKKE